MASKKKYPHSRRALDDDLKYLYCVYNSDDEDACNRRFSTSSETKIDQPDRVNSSQVPSKPERQKTASFEEAGLYRVDIVPDGAREKRLFEGPTFDTFDVLVGFSSIAFFYFDVVTDIILARDYHKQGQTAPFVLTTTFVVGPALVTAGLNFRWYLLDYRSQEIHVKNYGKEHVKRTSVLLWCCRFLMTFLLMSPVMRMLEYMYNGWMSNSRSLSKKERKRHYRVMRMEDVDASCIRMFECFLEAAPQLVLQIYILMSYTEKENTFTEILRGLAIASSWISLSWSLVAYHKALRYSHEDRANMSMPGMVFYFLWRLLEIGPRVIALGLFAALFKFVVLIIMGAHWMFMSAWLFCQKTRFYQNRCEEKAFNIVCGYVLIFCFLNVRDGRTRYRMLVFYFILFAENWAMTAFWLYFTPDKSAWYYLPVFFTMIISAVLQIIVQLIYYGFFHPLGVCQIPCCVPREEYSCYRSLCHDLEETEEPYYAENGQVPAPV